MSTIIDEKILSVYIVFGFLVVAGYLKMVYENWGNKLSTALLWSNNNQNTILEHAWSRMSYNIMIGLSFIAGIYLVYYLTTFQKDDTVQSLIYVGSVIFLVYSVVWAYSPFNKPQWTVKAALGFVAIGAILIMSGISLNVSQGHKDPVDIVALVAIIILVIQTSFFDFFMWNGFSPFNNKKRS